MDKLFYFLAFLSVMFGLWVVLAKNPIHSVLALVLTFFAIAGQYILLNAQFLALVNIIVYAGAIMVLFLFIIMFMNLDWEAEPAKPVIVKFAATISAGLLLITLIAAFKDVAMITPDKVDDQIGLIGPLGIVLFKKFLVPFEIASVLFLSAMIGAVILAKKEVSE